MNGAAPMDIAVRCGEFLSPGLVAAAGFRPVSCARRSCTTIPWTRWTAVCVFGPDGGVAVCLSARFGTVGCPNTRRRSLPEDPLGDRRIRVAENASARKSVFGFWSPKGRHGFAEIVLRSILV